ncbi:glutamate--tRNA ligase family protein [Pleomorphovibrio marinus]|uniref:glutamate--tRNA ligase family protein n=1 Tax=Pleomorphovibrio marinus TaxID=2164132 RepID=UPI000E0A208F|nr:glutamate--tRNA ligase family protein [Pleomorphovibrio marinus]
MVKNFTLTRFAPTPSGFLHLGNVLSFAITAAIAKKHGARILLRIDDLDQNRTKKEYIQDIFDTLNFLGFWWDIGPKTIGDFDQVFSQHQRIPYYKDALRQLMINKNVFACECSRKKITRSHQGPGYPGTCIRKKLELGLPGTSLRVFTPTSTPIIGVAYLSDELIAPMPKEMNGFIVRKKDQMPSYQLASLLDDIWFGVDLVVRGQDLYNSTLAQLYLSSLLPQTKAFKDTVFLHHPLLFDGKAKMAKSKGATSILSMRDSGMKPADIFQQIGNSLGIPGKMTSLSHLIAGLSKYDYQTMSKFSV